MRMKKKGEFMSDRTGNIIATIYLFLAGIITLNSLESSIATNASGIAFLIAAVYGVVAVLKNKKFIA